MGGSLLVLMSLEGYSKAEVEALLKSKESSMASAGITAELLSLSGLEFTISSGGMSHTVHTAGEALALLQRYSDSQDQ